MKLPNEKGRVREIDFLPAKYREAYSRRRTKLWSVVIVVAFASMLPTASLFQHRMRDRVEDQLAAVNQSHQQLEDDKRQLQSLQDELNDLDAKGRLITFLKHPWPRSQVLAAIVNALNDKIVLDELEINRVAELEAARSRLRSEESTAPQEGSATEPSAQDLETLRREYRGQFVVNLSGLASSDAQAHLYLGRLAKSQLFKKAELESLDSVSAEQSGQDQQSRFQAQLILRSGYGTPDGPAGPPPASTTIDETSETEDAS